MKMLSVALFLTLLLVPWLSHGEQPNAKELEAGFAEVDITPTLGKEPVFLAGFGKNRLATAVHDPIMARAVVLRHGKQKIALVSVDLVGLFLERIESVRRELPGFTYVLVSCTHNHEGPDTLGLWGASFFQSGIDPGYMTKVQAGIKDAVLRADKNARPVRTRIGTAKAPELVHDNREPYVKHDELVALQFQEPTSDKNVGVLVQWNCHPETLDDKNTRISADFVAGTCAYLQERYRCPVVYLTGTVGGLMTSLHLEVKDAAGTVLADGTFAKTARYGLLVGKLAERALADSKAISLTPMQVRTTELFLPLENQVYLLGWKLGMLERRAYVWTGDPHRAEPADKNKAGQKLCLRTELAWLRLGDLDVAAIPGEIYPELVLGKVQDPADPAADYPDAAIEPSIYGQMKGPHRMIIGLANDEIGYILPKRQWDEKAPFCYGRKKGQYGEVNSLGAETGPMICAGFRNLLGNMGN